ncbi:hypothetical protein [Ruminococcus sp. 5_1_39BFAA]|uniref:hypothetical protein n=1 Tax=Ruminococcus sp. 5_1_39BFAA TaxID=457412 RepID=UPI0035699777
MEYALTLKDFGQGKSPIALPVSRCTPQNMTVPRCLSGQYSDPAQHGVVKQHSIAQQHNVVNQNSMTADPHPYSAFEILLNCLHEDIGGVLNNYLQMEKAEIQRVGVLPNAQRMRLRAWHYYKTLSKLQQPTEATVVDFIIKGQVEGTDGNNRIELQNTAFRMRYIFDLRPCHQSCIGPLIWLNALWKDDPIFPGYWIETNEYLLPILRAKDYEHVAHDLLDCYFPENRKVIGGDTTVVEAEELAHRMGQRIEDVRFADVTIMGQIYYDYGEIDLIDDEGAVYRKRIRPGTILISKDNCSSAAVRNSTIVHECCHLYLDRWFFLLQMVAGRPYQAYSSRRKEHRRGIHRGTAIEWMEKQCEKLPAFLLMEREDTMCFVDRTMAEHGGVRSPESMRHMIELLAERNGVSFSMAKCRMIELGYYEAEGIREYVNGQVIPDHGCAGAWPEKATFTISAQDAAKLACADGAFESALRSGRYRYVEGHFCIDDERYCYIDEYKRIRLTYYARNHIDECCLAFKVNGCRMKGEFRQSAVFRKKGETGQYPSGYTLAAEPGTEGYEKENSCLVSDCILWMDIYKELEDEFGESIKHILKRKHLTQEALAGMLGVSSKALYNYLNSDRPSLPHIVGICVAMSLPYYISMELIENAGYALRKSEIDFLYRQFLLQSEQISVDRCEDILQKQGYPPLFRGEGNERNLPHQMAGIQPKKTVRTTLRPTEAR